MMDKFDSIGTNFVETPSKSKGQYYEKFVDIYDFFPILLDLFRKLGLIVDDFGETRKNLPAFIMTEEYPDELANDDITSVVYGLGERKFWNETNVTTPSPKIIQRKPKPLASGFDLVENNIVEDFAYMYDNVVRLEVYANSLTRLMQVTRLLESVFLKHKGYLKLYVHDLVYLGQSATEYHSTNTERRLFSRRLAFRVLTYSRFSLVTEEIKAIERPLSEPTRSLH